MTKRTGAGTLRLLVHDLERPTEDQVSMSGRSIFAAKGVPWAVGSLLLLLAAVSLYAFTGAAASEPSKASAPTSGDITYGPADAALSVIEYSDFECPFCAEYAPIMATLREKYGDQVQFVFRFFPLSNHEYGMISAQAAYAASLQGKFWEMHDLLFNNQKEWSESSDPTPYFDSYAESLGLDIEKFHTDMNAQTTIDFINAQKAEGEKAGVSHTPWFVVGDSAVLPRSLDEFEKLIEAGL
jgi:protein-disulfide isomerase